MYPVLYLFLERGKTSLPIYPNLPRIPPALTSKQSESFPCIYAAPRRIPSIIQVFRLFLLPPKVVIRLGLGGIGGNLSVCGVFAEMSERRGITKLALLRWMVTRRRSGWGLRRHRRCLPATCCLARLRLSGKDSGVAGRHLTGLASGRAPA